MKFAMCFSIKSDLHQCGREVLKIMKLPAYCSVEWQTKALCGEVMMPYEQTKNMTQREIMEKYQVSKGFAKTRQHYEKKFSLKELMSLIVYK